jgi:hypothetical protein
VYLPESKVPAARQLPSVQKLSSTRKAPQAAVLRTQTGLAEENLWQERAGGEVGFDAGAIAIPELQCPEAVALKSTRPQGAATLHERQNNHSNSGIAVKSAHSFASPHEFFCCM